MRWVPLARTETYRCASGTGSASVQLIIHLESPSEAVIGLNCARLCILFGDVFEVQIEHGHSSGRVEEQFIVTRMDRPQSEVVYRQRALVYTVEGFDPAARSSIPPKSWHTIGTSGDVCSVCNLLHEAAASARVQIGTLMDSLGQVHCGPLYTRALIHLNLML